ncbi:MAG: histidine kinase dimerization/phospho-acceptor domain-containing protein [Candidatus Acidiferrales bacterium]
MKQAISYASVVCVDRIERLCAMAKEHQPQIIIADDRILGSAGLAESIAELAAVAPVVLVAAYDRHAEIERMVVAGQADFVPRAADWELLAASLIERRLLTADGPGRPGNSWTTGSGDDMGEIFRHEINNPLTGILGNAELLLAHSEKFPAAETQRIRTVVELAVRLRETVRKVSDRWGKSVMRDSKCDLTQG